MEINISLGNATKLSTMEAAKLLNISPPTLRELNRIGAIPAVRVGKQLRFLAADIEAFLQENYG